MRIATSRITAQGQISVPKEVRRRLGLVPGASIEWDADGESIVVRRAGHFTSEDIHAAIFGATPPVRRSIEEMDVAIGELLAEKHARR